MPTTYHWRKPRIALLDWVHWVAYSRSLQRNNAGYTEAGNYTDNLPVFNWQEGGTTNYVAYKPYGPFGPWACKSDGASVSGTEDTGKDRMGAAFNYVMLHHEPGAYAHNRYYTKRLIFDSIDYLDPAGSLDGQLSSAYINNATAFSYLNDGVRP